MTSAVVRHRLVITQSDNAGLPADDPLLALGTEELGRLSDDLIHSWPAYGISEHIALEIAAISRRDRPLDVGASVPGCVCPGCTGISSEAPHGPTEPLPTLERWSIGTPGRPV